MFIKYQTAELGSFRRDPRGAKGKNLGAGVQKLKKRGRGANQSPKAH
jgi:hypothetical protein